MITNKKSNKIFGVGIALVLLITTLCMCLVGCSVNTVSEVPTTNEVAENEFSGDIHSTQFVKLAMSEAMAASVGGSVSKTITATVLPATASNKSVDWSVEWGDSSNTANVSSYLTVTPDSDGSTNATVTCYQAFTGTIVITVTTRESGYTANCVVSFVGVPTDIAVNGSIAPYGNNTYDLGIGETYNFNVGMTNEFNSVGAAYNDITCTLSGVGSVVLGGYDTAFGWYESTIKTVSLDSFKDNFISASYENGVLTITTVKSIESYYASMTRADGGRTRIYTDKFKEYVDDCYFIVVLHEQTSGIRKTLTFRFDDTVVTGVNASSSEMIF